MNNEHYLHYVGDDDLEAADDHGLGRREPTDGLGHEDTANNPEDGLLEAEKPGDVVPVVEQGDRVQAEDAEAGGDEAADGEPEDEDGVVDVSELPGDDGHPGREEGNCQGKAQSNHVIGFLDFTIWIGLMKIFRYIFVIC